MPINENILLGMKNYFAILLSPPIESDVWSYRKFVKSVKKAMKKPPFDEFMNGTNFQIEVLRREAAYLYDAVNLYAWSLNQTLLAKEDPRNGTRIIERLKNHSYKR